MNEITAETATKPGNKGHLSSYFYWLFLPEHIFRYALAPGTVAIGFAARILLTPVLSHTTPKLGHLSPTLEFDELFERLLTYVGFTPLNNAAGSPAMSLPLARTSLGLPLGVHFAADLGDERTLLELAFELEEARPFARIQDSLVER
jgi:hypothetical protein